MTTNASRRAFLQMASAGLGVTSAWGHLLADELAKEARRRQVVILWMSGGASQLDTFDMKPEHAHGGEFRPIETSVTGIRISEHLPQLAQQMDRLAIVRSLSTKEGDHGRGTYLMRTGRVPGGPVAFPTIGAALSKELGDPELNLPNYVAVAPYLLFNPAAYSPGFLGPQYAPATVGALNAANRTLNADGDSDDAGYAELGLDHVKPLTEVTSEQAARRRRILDQLQQRFLDQRPQGAPAGHDTVYRRARRMLSSQAITAFDLTQEPDKVRAAYGPTRFGQGCLMARRLIERGVSVVEVNLGFENGAGWDTHINNFPAVKSLSGQLDRGWATLMTELQERGLLETTTILWLSEFGRTPAINGNAGRDHFPAAWTCVLAGGGIRGGSAYGKTTADGMAVAQGKVGVNDVLATLCSAVGIAPDQENLSPIGRPFPLIDDGQPIQDILI